jgi:hypothetical protein
MKRIISGLTMAAAMVVITMVAATPAIAQDADVACIPVCELSLVIPCPTEDTGGVLTIMAGGDEPETELSAEEVACDPTLAAAPTAAGGCWLVICTLQCVELPEQGPIFA